jgi:hypothetical protein
MILKPIFLCFIFLLNCICCCFGQANAWLWEQTAIGQGNEDASAITTDSVGNVYVAGTFSGDTAWFGSTPIINKGSDVYFCDMFVAKYDALGNLIWVRTGGSNNNDIASGIAVDKNGNVLVTGAIYDTSFTFEDSTFQLGTIPLYLLKIDPNGNLIWARFASGISEGRAVVTDADNNIYLTGTFQWSISFGNNSVTSIGGRDIYLVKYDTNGNDIWAKSINGTAQDYAMSISIHDPSTLFITGYYFSETLDFGFVELNNSNSYHQAFMAKYDTAGNVSWAKSSASNSYVWGVSCSADQNGNCLFAGRFANSVSFGNVTLTGNLLQMFLIKYGPSGNIIWAVCAGPLLGISGVDLYLDTDSEGNAFVTGLYADSISFNGSVGLSSAPHDIFIAKYNPVGNPLWAISAGGIWSDDVSSITIDGLNNCLIAGSFSSPVIHFGSDSLTNTNDDDMYFAKLSNSVGITEEKYGHNQLLIFPQPASRALTISANREFENGQLEIFNLLGEKIYSTAYREQLTVNCEHFLRGIYFVRLTGNEIQVTRKLVVD